MVAHAVRHVRRSPNDVPGIAVPCLVAHHELPFALDHEVELVLARMSMNFLNLARFEAVEAQQQTLAVEHGGLEEFVGCRADVARVGGEIGHGCLDEREYEGNRAGTGGDCGPDSKNSFLGIGHQSMIMMPGTRFSVGDVVQHKLFDYRGVIVGVDTFFQGTEEWYQAVARSRPPKHQPWYHVLPHGAQHQTYVAEQNLEPDHSGLPIQHPPVERYFTDFINGRYVNDVQLH